jgi:hypothetical protein
MNSLLRPFERLADALADRQRAHPTAAALIAAYAVAWWVYAVIAKSSQDIHFDMGEVVSWSLVPAFGYPKHPPFPAWVVTVWFAIFPYRDWAYYLLATVSIAIALWFIWLIAARHVDGYKRVLALTFLMFSPGFNFQPIKFNSNALLIPVWAVASYLFLRAFHERTLLWGVLAGAAAAAAMLTKYWSAFLVIAFIVAATAHPRRLDYLRSPAPWAAVVAGALLLAPNIVSLLEYDFQPFRYATAAHEVPASALIASLADYAGGVLYLAGSIAVLLVASRPRAEAIRDTLVPTEPDRRLMMIVMLVAFLAPVPLALLLGTRLATLWTLPMWAMLPALLLSSRAIAVSRQAAAGALAAAVAVPLGAILLAPAIAYAIHIQGVPNHASHYRLIAAEVDDAWRSRTEAPLKLFGSNTNIVNGAGFYLPSQPLRIDIGAPRDTPWADESRIGRDGIALACPEAQAACMEKLNARAATLPRHAVTLSRRYFGVTDEPVRYVIVVVPPAGDPRR